MQKPEAQTLLEAYESVRNLSKFYISKLDKNLVHNKIEVNGFKVNSAYWIIAHLIWTERMLIIQGIGGQDMEDHWLDEYGMGSNPDEIRTKPDFDALMELFDQTHEKAVSILSSIKDEELDEQNHVEATFGGKSDKKAVLKHAIRHEPMHIGQLSWILKVTNPDSTP